MDMNRTKGDVPGRPNEAENKLQDAEQMNKVLTECVESLNNQLEEVTKSKDDLEESDKKHYKARLEKKEGEINELNKQLSEFENMKARYAAEFKRLKEYETIHPTLLDDIRRLEKEKLSYEKTMLLVEQEKQTLYEEKQSLLLRLSKIAGANLTLDNPNIADLSDGKRPTKLAEEFSELYDNEWTDAFEAIEIEDDKEKTTFMLKILQRANTICHELSNAHLQNIKESLCSLTLHIHVPLSNTDRRQTKEMENGTDNQQTEMNVDPESNAKLIHAEVSTEISVDDENANMNQNSSEPVSEQQMLKVVYDFEKIPNDQKKMIMELRKFIEISVSDQLETAAAKLIAFEFDLDPEKNELIVVFVRKCMNVCWSMCRQEPPVHIGFPSIQGDQSYDTSIYKPYTKTGKFLDFVVWPAVYLHEGGPLLSKGVAQGRN